MLRNPFMRHLWDEQLHLPWVKVDVIISQLEKHLDKQLALVKKTIASRNLQGCLSRPYWNREQNNKQLTLPSLYLKHVSLQSIQFSDACGRMPSPVSVGRCQRGGSLVIETSLQLQARLWRDFAIAVKAMGYSFQKHKSLAAVGKLPGKNTCLQDKNKVEPIINYKKLKYQEKVCLV